MAGVLVFVGVCPCCGEQTEPCPAEGPGESWKSAEQWLFLSMQRHKPTCHARAAEDRKGTGRSINQYSCQVDSKHPTEARS